MALRRRHLPASAARELQAARANDARAALDRIDRALQFAAKNDVATYCGRGITYKNLGPVMELGYTDEFIIGRSICARAALVGMDRAVRDMTALLQQPSRPPA